MLFRRIMVKLSTAMLLVVLCVATTAQTQELLAMANVPFSLNNGSISQAFTPQRNHPEAMLNQVLLSVRYDHLDQALKNIDQLVRQYPDFQLAQLVRGDLLLARAQPIQTLGNINAEPSQLDGLRAEARVRLNNYLQPPDSKLVPRQLLQLDTRQTTAVVVDTSKSRLYVFHNQNGVLTRLADFYVTIGKNGTDKTREGDKRTPLGVYYVTARQDGKKIGPLYGDAVYPLNYPNDWDQKEGRLGHGIWLHGTPSTTYSRAPQASDGCVVLTNSDLSELGKYLMAGITPVVITQHIDWTLPSNVNSSKDTLLNALESWRRDRESLDPAPYLRHYADDFTADGENLSNWIAEKRRVNQGKTWVKIKLSDISALEYPGQANMAVINFDQDYRSNNLNDRSRKRQYWQQTHGEWKIVMETSL
jgi:murein L,D-transpeptidase YafK